MIEQILNLARKPDAGGFLVICFKCSNHFESPATDWEKVKEELNLAGWTLRPFPYWQNSAYICPTCSRGNTL